MTSNPMGGAIGLPQFHVYRDGERLEPNRIYINSLKPGRAANVSFSFARPELEEELRRIIGDDPSAFRVPTRLYDLDTAKDDEILVCSSACNSPLIVSREGSLIVNFDVAMAQRFEYEDSKRPVYTYLPYFNIRSIPPAMRRPLSNLLASRKRCFDTLQEALAFYRKLSLNVGDFVTLALNRIACAHLEFNRPAYTWPGDGKAPFVSLHDVDSNGLLLRKKNDPLLAVENKHGIRGAWFFLTKHLIERDWNQVAFLKEDDHEIGWHGYNHDHKLPFGSNTRKRVQYLLRSILVDEQNAPLGMRTPKLLKSRHLFHTLARLCPALCYDTSFLTGIAPCYLTDESAGHRILEIPTTVPTDIRLYNELANLPAPERYAGILKIQIARTERLIDAGALISIVTHPEEDISEKPELLDVYDQYLAYLKGRKDVLFTTAGVLCKYWTQSQTDAA